jgi:hypothetical protein
LCDLCSRVPGSQMVPLCCGRLRAHLTRHLPHGGSTRHHRCGRRQAGRGRGKLRGRGRLATRALDVLLTDSLAGGQQLLPGRLISLLSPGTGPNYCAAC